MKHVVSPLPRKLEDYDSDVVFILRRTGLDQVLERDFKTNSYEEEERSERERWFWRCVPQPLVEEVERAYARDFQMFSYIGRDYLDGLGLVGSRGGCE